MANRLAAFKVGKVEMGVFAGQAVGLSHAEMCRARVPLAPLA